VLCVEEGWPSYGVTAELAARIQHACFDDLDAPIGRVGMAEVPMPYAKNLENAALPHEDKIYAAALEVLDLGPSADLLAQDDPQGEEDDPQGEDAPAAKS
jgi:pyruvate dehydrogenase E1 component beta subunit